MKKYLIAAALLITVIVFSNCHSTKKVTAAPKITYQSGVQTLVLNNCAPCHFPEKNGQKKALNNYTAVKDNIDEILHRIQLNPTDKGFMPFKHPKLNDSTITVFKQWHDNGMPEN